MRLYWEMLGDYFRSLGFRLTNQTLVVWGIGMVLLAVVLVMRFRFREHRTLVLLFLAYLIPELLYRPLTGFAESIFTVGKLLFWTTLTLIVGLLAVFVYYTAFRLRSGLKAKLFAVITVLLRVVPVLYYFTALRPAALAGQTYPELYTVYRVLSYLPFVTLFLLLLERYRVTRQEHRISGSKRHFESYWPDEEV